MSRVLSLCLLLLAGCASTTQPIPAAWTSVPEATTVRVVTLAEGGKVTLAPLASVVTPIRVEGNRLFRGEKALTEPFAAIDSFDYSASRDEVAFSAKREGGYDIGLVAGDGSVTNWMPGDPADEVRVQWAPRGNKISYVVRAPLGDVVRTLHIPTAYQFSNDFGPAVIHALAWEAAAEKYAVAYSTVDASDRVEVLHYDGRQRSLAIPPAAKIAADVVSFAPGVLALRPFDVRYGEKLPVVVWVTDSLAWSDARAALMKSARVAMVVTRRAPDADLWKAIGDAVWMDGSRAFVVWTGAARRPAGEESSALNIVADATLPAGRYRADGSVLAVAPAAIQSFAAGFIADQLKRTGPTNGSSR